MKTGIELIFEERQRQIEKEGYTSEHDILHGESELLDAALSYITLKRPVMDVTHDLDSQPSYAVISDYPSVDGTIHKLREMPPPSWPWGEQHWKPSPSDRIKELVKAGALIAAAIDVLQNKKNASNSVDVDTVSSIGSSTNHPDGNLPKSFSSQPSQEWSQEDEKMFEYALDMVEWYSGKNESKSRAVSDWLESLKDRVQLQPKQEWSEEDNIIIEEIINDIECARAINYHAPKEVYECRENWLKSLKPKNTWRPSDEQMDALHYVTNFDYGGHKATLVSLYEQLKKLGEK